MGLWGFFGDVLDFSGFFGFFVEVFFYFAVGFVR